jgi:hypothetical protein
MDEMNYSMEIDFDLSTEVVEEFQNVMFDRGLSVGFCSISGTGFVSQFREAIMCAMVKPSYRWFVHHGIFPDLQKNQAVIEFLDTDLSHILFIDHDTVPKDRLCLAKMLLADKPVISGVQAFKTYPTKWSVGLPKDKTMKKIEVEWLYGDDTSEEPDSDPWKFKENYRNKIQRVMLCGNGFLLVKREVLEEMEFPYFGTNYIGDKENWRFQGEDFWFAARCYQEKVPFYVHWGVKTEHVDGRRWYPLRFDFDEEDDGDGGGNEAGIDNP